MAFDKMEKASHYLIYENITGGVFCRDAKMEIHVGEFVQAAPKVSSENYSGKTKHPRVTLQDVFSQDGGQWNGV